MSALIIFGIFFVVSLIFFTGEWWEEEEKKAGLRYRFATNLATVFLDLPATFGLLVGLLMVFLADTRDGRLAGLLYIFVGAALFSVHMFLHKRFISKWL